MEEPRYGAPRIGGIPKIGGTPKFVFKSNFRSIYPSGAKPPIRYISEEEYKDLFKTYEIGPLLDYKPIMHPEYGLIYRDDSNPYNPNVPNLPNEEDFNRTAEFFDIGNYKTLETYVDNPFEWIRYSDKNYVTGTPVNQGREVKLFSGTPYDKVNTSYINRKGEVIDLCREFPNLSGCGSRINKSDERNVGDVINKKFPLSPEEFKAIKEQVQAYYSENNIDDVFNPDETLKKLYRQKQDEIYGNNLEYQKLIAQREAASAPFLESRFPRTEQFSPKIFKNNFPGKGPAGYVDPYDIKIGQMQANPNFKIRERLSDEENYLRYADQKTKELNRLRNSKAGQRETLGFDNLNAEYNEQFVPKTQPTIPASPLGMEQFSLPELESRTFAGFPTSPYTPTQSQRVTPTQTAPTQPPPVAPPVVTPQTTAPTPPVNFPNYTRPIVATSPTSEIEPTLPDINYRIRNQLGYNTSYDGSPITPSSGRLDTPNPTYNIPKDEYISGEGTTQPIYSNLDVAGGKSQGPELTPPTPTVKKEPQYTAKDWVIGGLEALSLGMGRNAALKAQQEQAFQMQQREQEPMFYSGYYGNRGMTTIGRNQNLIVAEDGALIQSTDTGLENALLERGEHVVYPNGKQMTVGGQKHADRVVNGQQVGGTKTTLPNGTMIFSDKLIVPNTKKTFASVAKKLGGQIEKYMEISTAVGKPRVDVETAELMLNRTIRSLDELFQIQQSMNGNHGEDYVDTVGGGEGEEEMPVAGNGMIMYDNGGSYIDFYNKAMASKRKDIFQDAMSRAYGGPLEKGDFEKATKVNQFFTDITNWYNITEGEDNPLYSTSMDKTKGNELRIKAIQDYLNSTSFKNSGIKLEDLGIFNQGNLKKEGDKYVLTAKDPKQVFDEEGIKKFQGIYRGAYNFQKAFGKEKEFSDLKLTPLGVSDQMMDGRPISPVDGWLGNTTIWQLAKGAQPYPKFEEPKVEEKNKPVTQSDGQTFDPAKAIRPSKYTGRPFDIKQLIPNVVAASQQIAPYVVPEAKQIRVAPYEQYVDPWVQDAYTMAMAASSMGADPNAAFINAQQSVDNIQAQKRNMDAQAAYAARSANAQFERQADMYNQNALGVVNNQMLNIAKSNKAEVEFNALQNALMKQNTYARNEALIGLNWNTYSPGFDYDANTNTFTPVKEYSEAMLGNMIPSQMSQFLYNPDLVQQARPTRKTKTSTTQSAE